MARVALSHHPLSSLNDLVRLWNTVVVQEELDGSTSKQADLIKQDAGPWTQCYRRPRDQQGSTQLLLGLPQDAARRQDTYQGLCDSPAQRGSFHLISPHRISTELNWTANPVRLAGFYRATLC